MSIQQGDLFVVINHPVVCSHAMLHLCYLARPFTVANLPVLKVVLHGFDVIAYTHGKIFPLLYLLWIFGEVWLCFVLRLIRPFSKVETRRAMAHSQFYYLYNVKRVFRVCGCIKTMELIFDIPLINLIQHWSNSQQWWCTTKDKIKKHLVLVYVALLKLLYANSFWHRS